MRVPMRDATNPLVSVVTPVYNGEAFLEECIESVLNQSYTNWEYIIVNNSSSDRTPAIIDAYARKDNRIKVCHTSELLPIMKNWNFALGQISAESKYCKVVHADDWLFPECLYRMIEIAESNPSVGLVGAYSLWGDKVVSDRLPYPSHFMRGQEIARLTLLDKIYPFWSPTSLLIRSDIIGRRRPYYAEKEGRLHADVEASYEVLRDADFGFVHQVLTFIRTHEASVTSTAAAPFNTYILTNLDLYTTYGPVFLTDSEFRSQLKLKLKKYYRFLAQSVFELREVEFWRYHHRTLQEYGTSLNPIKLLSVAIEELIRTPVSKVKVFIISAVGHLKKIVSAH